MSALPGSNTIRTWKIPVPGMVPGTGSINTDLIARCFGSDGIFNIKVGEQAVMQVNIPAVSAGPYDQFARELQSSATFATPLPSLDVTINFTGGINAQGWLNWFEISGRRNLSMSSSSQLAFRDWSSVGAGSRGNFLINQASAATRVWDVTNFLEPVQMQASLNGAMLGFVGDCSSLHEYIAFIPSALPAPIAIGKIVNQNLHGGAKADLLVVSAASLLAQAQRLAQYHRQRDGLSVTVVTCDQVFNEFSSGTPDPTAIRDFAKMYYDRAGGDSALRPRYLLLFGRGSFDYKDRLHGNTNLVPAYESINSLDPLTTYTSDDFFGFLEDGDDINGNSINLLNIGIGRIPARNEREAKAIVDKIVAYNEPASLGPWRNQLTFVADDKDDNLHLQDAEAIANRIAVAKPVFDIDKIYLDAYRQESGSGGGRYPAANQAINDRIFNGTLIWNYSGHGGYSRLSEEVVLDRDIINGFNNPHKLPLFITATCDFAPYDNPLVSDIGSNLMLRERTGAIALMTTARLVFAYSNREMNRNYLDAALQRKQDSSYRSLGETVREAKNYTYRFSGDMVNNRKFALLGDPALTLGFPIQQVRITAINGKAPGAVPDTLKAMVRYDMEGVVTDNGGNVLNDFNGTVYPLVFDKPVTISTLANNAGSIKTDFQVQRSVLFRGKARAANGRFAFSFIAPRDIDYRFGMGKISCYAENGKTDASGWLNNIVVGGSGGLLNDKTGPDIRLFLNDQKFVSGGIANERPLLIAKLSDSSGINVMGAGIGHDLVAEVDHDMQRRYVLNDFYISDTGNFRQGTVQYQLPQLEPGLHQLTLRAWDALNNSSEASIEFRIVRDEGFVLEHVLNYPNPFTTHTNFWFNHNRPGEELRVTIQVYTVSGKLVKTLRRTIISSGNRSCEVEWDGRDEYGEKIGRGVYIYRLSVRTSDGKTAEKLGKLYLL